MTRKGKLGTIRRVEADTLSLKEIRQVYARMIAEGIDPFLFVNITHVALDAEG